MRPPAPLEIMGAGPNLAKLLPGATWNVVFGIGPSSIGFRKADVHGSEQVPLCRRQWQVCFCCSCVFPATCDPGRGPDCGSHQPERQGKCASSAFLAATHRLRATTMDMAHFVADRCYTSVTSAPPHGLGSGAGSRVRNHPHLLEDAEVIPV